MRNLFSGRSGLQGILAVHVYECGYTGLEDGPTDILGSILGEQFDREAVVEGLQEGDYRIQKNYFKFHACCRINHPSLDAVVEACAGAEFSLDDVEAVEISTPAIHPDMMGAYPENMLSAKFNVPYAVAAAIVRNRTDVTSFFPEAISDGRIRNIASKVNIQVNPEVSKTSVYSTLATAFIRLKDGRSLEGNTTIVRGDYGNRVLKEELVDKFHFLTDEIIGPKRAESIVNAVDRLEQISDIRELLAHESLPFDTWDMPLAEALDAAGQYLKEKFGDDKSRWTWGGLHAINFRHGIGREDPAASLLNAGTFPAGGSGDTVNAGGHPGGASFNNTSIVTYRQIIDLSDFNKSLFIVPPGQSGHVGSPHYNDLLEDYLAVRYRPLLWDWNSIEAESEQTLEP